MDFDRVEVYEYPESGGSNNQSPRSVATPSSNLTDDTANHATDSPPSDAVEKKSIEIDLFESERIGKRRTMEQFHKSDLYREWIVARKAGENVVVKSDLYREWREAGDNVHNKHLDHVYAATEDEEVVLGVAKQHELLVENTKTNEEEVFGVTEPYKLAMEKINLYDDVHRARKAEKLDALNDDEEVVGVAEPNKAQIKTTHDGGVRPGRRMGICTTHDEEVVFGVAEQHELLVEEIKTEDDEVFGVTEPYKLAMETIKSSPHHVEDKAQKTGENVHNHHHNHHHIM